MCELQNAYVVLIYFQNVWICFSATSSDMHVYMCEVQNAFLYLYVVF